MLQISWKLGRWAFSLPADATTGRVGEGHPGAEREALAVGKATIARVGAAPGMANVAEDEPSELVTKPRDAAALVGALRQLLSAPQLGKRWGGGRRPRSCKVTQPMWVLAGCSEFGVTRRDDRPAQARRGIAETPLPKLRRMGPRHIESAVELNPPSVEEAISYR